MFPLSGTRHIDGGGLNYGAHVAAMMGLRTAAVTRLSNEDRRVVDALVRIGVTVYPLYARHSTDMLLFYPSTDPDRRTLSVTHTAGSFTPDQVENLQSRAFLINSSIRGEVGMDVIPAIYAPRKRFWPPMYKASLAPSDPMALSVMAIGRRRRMCYRISIISKNRRRGSGRF